MKVHFDTSVLIAASVDAHPCHEAAFPWLLKVKRKEIAGCIGSHTLAELYSVLTGIPSQKKIPCSDILRLIKESVISHFEIISLSDSDYQVVLQYMAEYNVRGGSVYDALIACAAQKADADKLITFNPDHFIRVYPSIADRIEEPGR